MATRFYRLIWLLALFVVVAAHALVATALLVSWQAPVPQPEASAPLTVTLAQLATSSAEKSQVEQKQVKPEPPPEPEPKPEPKPQPKPKPKSEPLPKPEAKPKPKPVVQPQQQKRHIEARKADKTQARRAGASKRLAQAKQRWRTKVATLLQQHKRYPRLALLRGQEGAARVSFVLDRHGRVLSVKLADSSGYVSLDQEALDLIRRVAPFPPPPADIKKQKITLTVPISFDVH